jgi:hypothetical protein
VALFDRLSNPARPRINRVDQVPGQQLAVSGLVVACIAASSAAGLVDLSLVDNVVLLGVAVVLPLALGGRWWWWPTAALSVLVSLSQPIGWRAAVFVLPWMVASIAVAINAVRATTITRWNLPQAAAVLAPLYALVAAVAFASSRLGIELFGIGEPIVELTAIHYTYAGSAALVLVAHCLANETGAVLRAAQAATLITALAPPIVATGFVTHAGVPQVGGAVLMTIGVGLTATLELRAAFSHERPLARVLLGASGIAIWIPMVLAVAWAAAQHWDVPALSIPDMERTHGVANALAFVLCGLLGRRLERSVRPR